MNNFELLYSLFNQYLFTEAKNNILNIKYYFDTNPSTAGNPLVENMLAAIRDYEFEAIAFPLFQSIMMKCGKSEAESSNIMAEIMKWKGYSKEQMLPAKDFLEKVCAKVILDRIGKACEGSPIEYIKQIKKLDLQLSTPDIFSTTDFDKIDINSLVAEANNGFIPSHYSWINDTFAPYPGYEKGQIVIVCAAPGTGKSLFMMSEALHMAAAGKKVLYVGMGDNKLKDFVIRLGAMYTGQTFGDTMRHIGDVYNSLRAVLRGNLKLSINPAGKVSADKIVEHVKANPDLEVVIVDYDSNMKGVDGDNMYSSFGSVYEELTELTQLNKLVFIGSQTKTDSWDKEVINMRDVGESSRKQHSADMIIGIGKVISCPNHVHCFNISKNRRGELDVKSYSIRLGNGRFFPICKALYDELKTKQEKINYTEQEITMLNEQFLSRSQSIYNAINNAVTSPSPLSSTNNITRQQPNVKNNPFSH